MMREQLDDAGAKPTAGGADSKCDRSWWRRDEDRCTAGALVAHKLLYMAATLWCLDCHGTITDDALWPSSRRARGLTNSRTSIWTRRGMVHSSGLLSTRPRCRQRFQALRARGFDCGFLCRIRAGLHDADELAQLRIG